MHRKATQLTAILCLVAGQAFAAGVQGPQQPTNSSTAAQAAAASLDLQPGDSVLIERALQNPMVFEPVAGSREFRGELIVHAKRGKVPTADARVAPLSIRKSVFVPEQVIRVPKGMSEGQLAAVLMATGDYEFVEPNWTLFPAINPNDPQFGSSWQHTRLQSANAWNIETGTSDIIVAVCDSGVDTNHPDLQDALIPGFNSASNRAQVNGGDVEDINGHGSFVSGCAAAQGNNATGVVGVGWDFSIMPIRVTNSTDGTASSFAILDGARWAAENGAKIVNASFSGGTSASNQSTGSYLKEQGALLFWAAGNDSSFVSPNRPDYVLVASTTSSDNRSGFSNFGPAVDVAAPGSSVRSTRRGGTYGTGSGTSYASPIAAGVGAMIFSVNPGFIPDDVQDILYKSVDDLGATGRDDNFGRGRVNTFNAVQLAQTYVRPTVLPISSGFEDASWSSLLNITAGSPALAAEPDAPEGNSVLLFEGSEAIESIRLAGRTLYDDAMVSFALKAQGVENGESMSIEYLQNPETSGPDSWATLAQVDNRGLVSSEFVRYNFELPAELEWHGVQIRFVSDGNDSSDVWMLDDLSIDLIPESGAPLVENFESDLLNPVAWRTVVNTTTVFDSNTFAAQLADNATLQSFDVPLLQFGFVQPYLRFNAWDDAQTLAGDTMDVEVYTVGGTWETIDTISGSDLSTSPQLMQYELPIISWAIDNMKVRFTTSTSGSFMIDDVYLGVDPLSGGCSEADLAEPFGELNFFDVSAFLAAFSSNDPIADFNGDGQFNFFDVSGYLSSFNAGCP